MLHLYITKPEAEFVLNSLEIKTIMNGGPILCHSLTSSYMSTNACTFMLPSKYLTEVESVSRNGVVHFPMLLYQWEIH
jgi:hypothetical protein